MMKRRVSQAGGRFRSGAAGPKPEPGRDFSLQEHGAMQTKLDRAGEDIYRTEIVVPAAIGAFYVWLLSNSAPSWLYLVPPFLAFLGGAKYVARVMYIRSAEKYVRQLEHDLRGPRQQAQGWEHFYEPRLNWYLPVRLFYWIALFAATAAIAIFGIWWPHLLR